MADPSTSSFSLELIEKARNGDRQAFSHLVNVHEHRLRCLVHVRLGARLRKKLDVEDVLQETYLRAFRSIGQFRPGARNAFLRWIGAIAEHVIQDLARFHLQAQKRASKGEVRLVEGHGDLPGNRVVAPKADTADAATPSEILRRQQRLERLEKALSRLTPDHREVVILTLIRGLPTKDVGSLMGRTADAVSMLLLRALRNLRIHFGDTDSLHLPRGGLDRLGGDGLGDGPGDGGGR